MSDLKKRQRGAMEAVARRFSAKWEAGTPYIHAGGKRISVDLRLLEPRGTRKSDSKPHLRFDKVATRVIERLRATLGEIVPEGMTVVVTITAPIRLASKTTAAIEEKIQALIRRRSKAREAKDTIHGNDVRMRFLRAGSARAPKMIGFVHNPETDPVELMDMAEELLDLAGTAPNRAGERWLAVISGRGASGLEAYRWICSQLAIASDFKKSLMVFDDGSVEELSEMTER